MKSRLLLIFTLLALLGLSLAGAATAEPVAPAAAPVADASPSTASFLCGLSQTSTAPEVAGGLTPAPVLKSGGPCGPCSLSPCVGATIGNFCQVGTRRGTCQNVYGDICTGSGTITNKCQCWNGPLP
jgi:hypothetical protein